VESSPITYEQQLRRIQAIVQQLQQGRLGVDESIRLFDEGMAIIHQSQAFLEQAEQHVQIVSATPNGLTFQPFSASDYNASTA
jgi:exodeoxyribonuclease VII small subunit